MMEKQGREVQLWFNLVQLNDVVFKEVYPLASTDETSFDERNCFTMIDSELAV